MCRREKEWREKECTIARERERERERKRGTCILVRLERIMMTNMHSFQQHMLKNGYCCLLEDSKEEQNQAQKNVQQGKEDIDGSNCVVKKGEGLPVITSILLKGNVSEMVLQELDRVQRRS
jgi:hypothetical protein